MAYEVKSSERAEEQLDGIIGYVIYSLKSIAAAKAIMADLEEILSVLRETPGIYPFCSDAYLAEKGYRKIPFQKHRYILIYRVDGKNVYIVGIFHMLENYIEKL